VSALRRCRQPVPARAAVDGSGRPVRITTDRRGFAGGTVISAAGPWRTSGEWWVRLRDDVASARQACLAVAQTDQVSEGWDRDEWDVALSDGVMYRVFRDRVTEGWFIDAVVD
jgi:hypothetical protein